MNSYDVIAEKVKDYWKDSYPQDVIAFFQQKYSWDDKWEKCEELVECHGDGDYENMTFLSDFCEGQTDVKDVVIIPLRDVTAFYYAAKIKPITNADRIRSMTDEELARYYAKRIVRCYGCEAVTEDDCFECQLDWLKSPSDKEEQT